jgi:hypothetical protein
MQVWDSWLKPHICIAHGALSSCMRVSTAFFQVRRVFNGSQGVAGIFRTNRNDNFKLCNVVKTSNWRR